METYGSGKRQSYVPPRQARRGRGPAELRIFESTFRASGAEGSVGVHLRGRLGKHV